MEMEHFLGFISVAFSIKVRTWRVLCSRLYLLFQLLSKLFAFSELLFEFEIASLGVVKLILKHGLLALQLFLVLLNQDQLLIFHIFQLIF